MVYAVVASRCGQMPLPGVRAQLHQHARHFRVAIEHGEVQRQPA